MKKRIIIISIVIIGLIILLILYGTFISSNSLKTNEIKLVTNIIDSYNGLKVVHISDLYYKKNNRLKDIIKEINLLKPDILVITGDLLNKDIIYTDEDINYLIDNINDIKTTLGKYIVKGDNDNNDIFNTIITETNLINLDDTYKFIFDNTSVPIVISGVNSDINKLNESINSLEIEPCYSILLVHNFEDISNNDLSKYNLILSGHTLGGVKLPIIGRLYKGKYVYGKYDIGNSILYVSNGLSSPKAKYRFSNEPSINLYRIVK